ncbi:MAG: hypothetical protein QG639_713, partial [Patescibacteria group bacterium]|nr:hypothetical protein [Patescibacteria group bacterium]
MRAIETETQTSQASLQEKKKRKRRKVLLLLLLLLLLLGLTFTSVSRFFWNSSRDTASTDPRTPAQVEVIETGDDANTKKSITGLESMVASLQQSVQELESHDHPLPSSDDDLPPQSISYDAYQNLKDNNHLDQPVNTSILTRGIIT